MSLFYFFYFFRLAKCTIFERNFSSMKKLWFAYFLLFPLLSVAQTISVDGAYCYQPENAGDLTAIYVVPTGEAATLHYFSSSTAEIRWYRFGSGGTSSRVEVVGVQSCNIATLPNADKDCGYMAEQEGVGSICVWLASYRSITACTVADRQENVCESVLLQGEGFAIPYYTTNGRRGFIPRQVRYTTAVWDESAQAIRENETVTVPASVVSDTEMEIPAPYGYSTIAVIDAIPEAWGAPATEIPAGEYDSPAILMNAVVEQQQRDAANESGEMPSEGFGGSAPVNMTFTAYVNGNNYYAWEFASDEEFTTVDVIYPEQHLEYAFKEEGTTYVRLHAYNDFCERDTMFTVSVGESKLEAPNAFSPYGSPGVNDEWKVAYKSIVDFKCWIFNRWGEEIFRFEDPALGWDGRYRGKLVPPGVYYYVIEAHGADGQKYKLKGHINILRPKNIDKE